MAGRLTQQRASVRPCEVGALLCLDLLVLLGQSLPRLFRGQKNKKRNAKSQLYSIDFLTFKLFLTQKFI